MTSDTDLVTNNDGYGYAFSLELGRIFDLNENWSLTPQGQLSYTRATFDSFVDSVNSEIVSAEAYESLEGRLGLALNYENTLTGDDGGIIRNKLYGVVNYYHEFMGEAKVDVSTLEYKSDISQDWVGLGIGGSRNWADDKYSVYGEVGARSSTDHFGNERAFTGEVGFRFAF